jgi:hypothetical protein
LNAVSYSTTTDRTINSISNADAAFNFVTVFLQTVAPVKPTTQLVGCSFEFASKIIQTIFAPSAIYAAIIKRSVKLPDKRICALFNPTNEIFNRPFVGIAPTIVSSVFSAVIIPVTPLSFGNGSRNDENSKKEYKRHCQASNSVN